MNANAVILKRLMFATAGLLAMGLIPACVTTPQPAAKQKETLVQITLLWLKDPANVADRQKLIDTGRSLARDIPEVQRLSIGPTFPFGGLGLDPTFDICLVMQFADEDALDRYIKHPAHQKAVADVFVPFVKQTKCYNFISE